MQTKGCRQRSDRCLRRRLCLRPPLPHRRLPSVVIVAVAARTAAKTAIAMPARRPSPFPFAGRPRSSEPPRGLDVEIKLIVLVPLLRFVRPDVVVSITGVARILSREPLACVDPARKPLASVDSARDPLVYTILDRGEYPRHGLDEDDADAARDVGAVPPRDVVVGKVGQLRRQFNSLTHRKHRNQKLSYFGAGLRSRDRNFWARSLPSNQKWQPRGSRRRTCSPDGSARPPSRGC